MKMRDVLAVAYATVLILLVPLVAMQFASGVNWGLGDFLMAGVLLFVAGNAMVFAARRIHRPRQRMAVVGAIALVLALVWAELAVGLFR